MDRPGPEGSGEPVPAIKALFVTSEIAGLAKAGGLGEVSAGLPLALRQRGIDIRVLMPAYREVIAKLPGINWSGDLPGRAGIPPARIGEARLPDGIVLYLVATPSLFDRRGTPPASVNGWRFPTPPSTSTGWSSMAASRSSRPAASTPAT
jgi:starch synthase